MKKILIAILVFALAFTAVMCGCENKETPEVPVTVAESINESDNGYEKSFVL